MAGNKKILKVLLLTILLLGGCASTPEQAVKLSHVTGTDLQAVYESYDKLIHQFYENLRSQRRTYLDEVWFPRFLENWRNDGELIAIAKGEKIWSVEKNKLIPTPANSDPSEQLQTLNDWVTFALFAYEKKEESLLKSLNEEEQTLRAEVKEAFDRLILANATVTAYLNSLQKVQIAQDEVLDALNLKELRDKTNKLLVNASEKAEKALNVIKEKDQQIKNLAKEFEKQ